MSDTTNHKPVHTLRRRGVKVSIFANHSQEATFHKVTVQKIYRDDANNWKTTTSFGREDLPVARMLIGRAWEWILDREAEPNSE